MHRRRGRPPRRRRDPRGGPGLRRGRALGRDVRGRHPASGAGPHVRRERTGSGARARRRDRGRRAPHRARLHDRSVREHEGRGASREPHPGAGDFLSAYDETKYLAHRLAERRAESGAPVTIAAPGAVYGPEDHSEIGNQLDQLRAGKLRFVAFPETGFNALHVEDAADGILRVLERGEVGATYPLGGEITTLGDILETAARILGRRLPPRLPSALVKAGIPFGRLIGPAMGVPPNIREVVRAADGVTYWASDARAREELGYAPRGLETGLRETLTGAP
ncbi:MAG TPA: NAD-dependent epimerase/dehydratase family protein [Actinomycetota bacterium]